jgi:hypothetical protein
MAGIRSMSCSDRKQAWVSVSRLDPTRQCPYETYLFLYHPVLNTIDNLIPDIDEVTIMFVVPEPHKLPGLQPFIPTTLDDPLIVLISCSFPPEIITAASVAGI